MIEFPVKVTAEGNVSPLVSVVMLLPMEMPLGAVKSRVPIVIAPVVVAVPVLTKCSVVVLSPFAGPTLIAPVNADNVTVLPVAGVKVPPEKVMLLLDVLNPTAPVTLIVLPAPDA